MNMLEERYSASVATIAKDQNPEGMLAAVQFYYVVLANGVQRTVAIGDRIVKSDAFTDSEAANIYGDADFIVSTLFFITENIIFKALNSSAKVPQAPSIPQEYNQVGPEKTCQPEIAAPPRSGNLSKPTN
ncbi:MAG: hypothetical protein R2867_22170 [Caldilineaceae bacterium]